MPVIRAAEGTVHEVHGATFTAYANSGTGSAQLCAWDLRIPPGQPGLAFAPDPAEATRRMQQVTIAALDALCGRLGAGTLTVLRSYDPAAHDLHGRVLGIQGKLDEARIQFEESLRIDPGFAQAREDLKEILRVRLLEIAAADLG